MLVLPLFAIISHQDPSWGPPPPVAPFSVNPVPSERVVISLTFPVLGQSRWKDGYGDMRGGFRHTGIDIRAPKMTPIVAPFSGTLGMKRNTFWIYGDSGWLTLGTHLNDDTPGTNDNRGDRDLMFAPDIYPGCHVHEGQFLGYVGNSGDATAPHLHFEIYQPGGGLTAPRIRNPFPSLQKARILKTPIVNLPREEARPGKDEYRLQGCVRRVDLGSGVVTLQLVAKQFAAGPPIAVTQPRQIKVRTSDPEFLRQLENRTPTNSIGIIVSAKSAASEPIILRLIL